MPLYFVLSEACLQGELLEVGLPGQRVKAHVDLWDLVHPQRGHQFACHQQCLNLPVSQQLHQQGVLSNFCVLANWMDEKWHLCLASVCISLIWRSWMPFCFSEGHFFNLFWGNCFSCHLLFFLHDFCASVSQLLKVLCILEPFTFYLWSSRCFLLVCLLICLFFHAKVVFLADKFITSFFVGAGFSRTARKPFSPLYSQKDSPVFASGICISKLRTSRALILWVYFSAWCEKRI